MTSPRRPKLPFTATRVLKASNELSAGLKLLWLEVYALDNGEQGCWAGPDTLAQRLGVQRATVEDRRRELVRSGVLESHMVPGQRTRSWYPTVPPDCIPTSSRPTMAEISNCAGRLDGVIRQARLSVRERTPLSPSFASANGARASTDKSETGVRPPTPEPAKGIPAPTDKGVPQPTQGSREVGVTTPTSPPPSEVGVVERPDDEVGDGSPLGEDSASRLARLHEIVDAVADGMAMDGPRGYRQ